MKIINTYPKIFTHYEINKKYETRQAADSTFSTCSVSSPISYKAVSFGAVQNIKTKKLDADVEKNKLLKQFQDILETGTEETDLDDIIASAIRSALSHMRTVFKRQKELLEEIEEVKTSKTMSLQQKSDRAAAIHKQWKLLEKGVTKPKEKSSVSKNKDEKTDLQLVNRFKSAITEDNYDLDKVLRDYYGDLSKITTVEELNKRYPKIKTPKNPAQVIAKKIEAVLTRDFYEKFDDLYEEGNDHALSSFADNKIREILKNSLKGKNADFDEVYKKITAAAQRAMINRYAAVKTSDSFSSLPEYRKNSIPMITENDLKLLSVDFDDFVLSTVKKQYLENQKLNEIKYEKDGIQIALNTLKEPDYKFEKIPEKIKSFINSAKNIKAAQRDYERFDTEELKARLTFHANTQAGDSERLLERIISFATCNFGDEDKKVLIKFLRELDNLQDGIKTTDEAAETAEKENYKPVETERQNEAMRKLAEIAFKEEQKKASELKNLRKRFDDAMNFLYEQNMNNLANTCSKYRPQNLETESKEKAEFLINKADDCKKRMVQTGLFADKEAFEAGITRWDTYNYYQKNDKDNPIFQRAVNYARNENTEVDIEQAGQFIINSEIAANYPESKSFAKNPDVLEIIMEKTFPDEESAIHYLCLFDKYQDLTKEEKTRLSNINDLFDTKDSVEKAILKNIIENDYTNCDTTIKTNLKKGEEITTATICSRAKKQILEKYKFPLCLEFMKSFEDALPNVSNTKGNSGIKQTGRNNEALGYKIELKISGHDDRLFSSMNDYRFDIFSERGLH